MSNPQTLFTQLARDAEEGLLFLEPDAAATCAQACADFLIVLDQLQREAEFLQCKEAFGHLPSAQALGQKFDDKAIGPGGFAEVLQQHIDTVTRMKTLFETAGRAYVETDAETRDRLAAVASER
ncbi:hypothetical protein [Rhodococcus zopfii]|uniref:hypothetical protein n=1 Tax=Rhodococcus zopfii TaxID=43772 RepID=UPI003529830C